MKDSTKDVSIGVERNIDSLGRVVLPKEMRNRLQLKENQAVNIKLFENYIQIEKTKVSCFFCGSTENLKNYKGSTICMECLKEIICKFNK
ncbi:AbrB/MazE/SpoVT family DNA-binding domain-containing protein [Paraclostridium sp. AKS46]|nr:AbrB/MazE/SpoVT family DNA-binding domain-containing protein [Paraclostridium sp. AKS46]